MICKSDDGTLLFCESEHVEKPRASLLIIHGLGEHLGRYQELAAFAKKQKFDVHMVDLRGHGRSSGVRGHVEHFSDFHRDIETWIQHLESSGELRRDLPCFLLGHSLGGLIALTYLAQRKERPLSARISGLVLSSPALGLKPGLITLLQKTLVKRIPKLFRSLQIPNGIRPEQLSHDRQCVARYKSDPLVHPWVTPSFFLGFNQALQSLPKALERIHVPVLFLLAGKDQVVDSEASSAFAERLSETQPGMVTVKCFHGFYHEIFNETKRERAYHALQKWLKACLLGQTHPASSSGLSKSSKKEATERAALH